MLAQEIPLTETNLIMFLHLDKVFNLRNRFGVMLMVILSLVLQVWVLIMLH